MSARPTMETEKYPHYSKSNSTTRVWTSTPFLSDADIERRIKEGVQQELKQIKEKSGYSRDSRNYSSVSSTSSREKLSLGDLQYEEKIQMKEKTKSHSNAYEFERSVLKDQIASHGNDRSKARSRPIGFTDNAEHDTVAALTWITSWMSYFREFKQKHQCLNNDELNRMCISQFNETLEEERAKYALKYKRGDEDYRLPIQSRLISMRKLRGLPTIEEIHDTDELIQILKETYVTTQKISQMEEKFNSLKQGTTPLKEYILYWSESLSTLLTADPNSGYQNNQKKQIQHFINGIADQQRKETLREKSYTTLAALMEKCETLVQDAESDEIVYKQRRPYVNIQDRIRGPNGIYQAENQKSENEKLHGGKIYSGTSKTIMDRLSMAKKDTINPNTRQEKEGTFGVHAFRSKLVREGMEICTRCTGPHYLWNFNENRENCQIEKGSDQATELQAMTRKDLELGYNQEKDQEYIDEFYVYKRRRAEEKQEHLNERNIKTARHGMQHTSPTNTLPSRFSSVAGNRGVQMRKNP